MDFLAEGGEEEDDDDDLEVAPASTMASVAAGLECRLLEAAHSFVTLRAQKKWPRVVEMCDGRFRHDNLNFPRHL